MKKAIMISCFDWYDKRLEPIKSVLVKDYNVKIVLSDFDHINKKQLDTFINECEYLSVPRYNSNVSFARIKSHICFAKSVGLVLRSIKPDLIYVLLPPNSLAKVCVDYKKNNPDVKLIFDIIDLWPESLPLFGLQNIFPFTIWKNLRDKNLCYADLVFTECSFYKNILNSSMIDNSFTLHLLKEQKIEEIELVNNIIENRIYDKNRLYLCYLGSINNIIDIDRIINVVGMLKKEYCIEVHIIGDGEKKREFIQRLGNTDVSVVYHGKIFDEMEKIKILSKCDYGLNIMKDSVKVGLTIKSVDYFSYGLPIINNIKGDTWELVESSMIGINIKDSCDKLTDCIVVNKNVHKHVIEVYKKMFSREAFIKRFKEGFSVIK